MTTTPPAISSGRADDDGPTHNADPPIGSRMASSRPGRSLFPVLDRHGTLTKGIDSAAYGRYCATPPDRASRERPCRR